jgi:nanoRNase/pAp phosphatase (c-di-AMP/oligoRNAs hydrolase)
MDNTYYDEHKRIIYSVITEQDLEQMESTSGSTFEGFVETLNKVPEAKFAMFLKQDGEVIKGSLRSDPHKGIDVGYIARTLGGGGHMWASGFSVVGHLEKDEAGKWQVIKNQN